MKLRGKIHFMYNLAMVVPTVRQFFYKIQIKKSGKLPLYKVAIFMPLRRKKHL